MQTKKYYIREVGEEVDEFAPIVPEWASPEIYQLIYETACRALTFQTLLLSTRARNCLERNKIDSMWELKHLNRAAIRQLPWVGRKVRDELYTVIKEETGIKLHNLL
jgi:DNA-directed RNA polymerase alpha subunit